MATLPKKPKPLNIYQAYRDTFSGTQAGREVLADLEKAFHLRRSFAAGDPHKTAFQEGQRDVYLRIRHMIDNQEDHAGTDSDYPDYE